MTMCVVSSINVESSCDGWSNRIHKGRCGSPSSEFKFLDINSIFAGNPNKPITLGEAMTHDPWMNGDVPVPFRNE